MSKSVHEAISHQRDQDTSGLEADDFYLFKMNASSSPSPIEVQVTIEGKDLKMEVDTGAAVSIISDSTRVELFSHLKLHLSKVVVRTYMDELIEVVGELNVNVHYGEQRKPLAGDGPSLFGRNWLKYL